MNKRLMIFPTLFLLVTFATSCNVFSPEDSAKNVPPTIEKLAASLKVVPPGGSSIITCSANDPNGDQIFYMWQVTSGQLRDARSNAVWESPNGTGPVTISVTVSDIWGAATEASVVVQISQDPDTLGLERILVDATHGGGVWWFPQSHIEGFDPDKYHQGQALAETLRDLGYQVDELPRGTTVTSSLLNQYRKVIRAGKYGTYSAAEIQAYLDYVGRNDASLVLFAEYLRPGINDELSEALGLPFRGVAFGWVSAFEPHAITDGAEPFEYIAGSVLLNPDENPDVEVLGRLRDIDFVDLNGNDVQDSGEPGGAAVMGILHTYPARVFFLGELNGIEQVPQPLVDNLATWAFSD
jgi:hypothetical protein